jgi:hypothetical protein
MENIYKPLTPEKKEELKKRGYMEWEEPYLPRFTDPDEPICKTYYLIN